MTVEGLIRTPMGVYVLRDDTCISRWVEQESRLDLDRNLVEIKSFAHRIPEGGVVIDAGANIGDCAITFSQIVGYAGQVYAFEPHPLAFKALSLNTSRFANVTPLEAGLSDQKSQVHFTPDPNSGASFVSSDGPIVVKVTTLDALLLPILERCDLIHLDVEGFEPRVLRGGFGLIQKFHPLLLVEVCNKHLVRAESSESELMDILVNQLGYTVTPIPTHVEPELRDVLCVYER